MTHQPPVNQGLVIVEASRSHSDTPHSVGLLWTSDQPSQRPLLTTHATHNRQTSMPAAVFELAIPAGERPQIYALNLPATGTGLNSTRKFYWHKAYCKLLVFKIDGPAGYKSAAFTRCKLNAITIYFCSAYWNRHSAGGRSWPKTVWVQ